MASLEHNKDEALHPPSSPRYEDLSVFFNQTARWGNGTLTDCCCGYFGHEYFLWGETRVFKKLIPALYALMLLLPASLDRAQGGGDWTTVHELLPQMGNVKITEVQAPEKTCLFLMKYYEVQRDYL